MKVVILSTDNREAFRDYGKPAPYFGTAPEALLQGFAALPEIEVHVVSCAQRSLPAPGKLADNIWFHSLHVPKIGWMRTAYQGCIRATRKKIHEINPDIVHGQGTERDCALSAVFSGFPNVLTIHGNMRAVAKINGARPFSFQWLAARLEAIALPRTLGVFCNSSYTESLVRPCARRTWRVPNALRELFFNAPPSLESNSIPVLLNIGVVEPRKSQVKILEMGERLHRRNARFALQFVGRLEQSTPYGAQFRELIDQVGKLGYASYLGEKSQKELVELMDKADGFIHAPTEEAFGLVVAEGLSRNLKFFGFNEGGILDIATGVEGAELVEPGNFSGLEEAILKWLSSGHRRLSGASERMRDRYHPTVIARRHVEIYREAISAHSRTS